LGGVPAFFHVIYATEQTFEMDWNLTLGDIVDSFLTPLLFLYNEQRFHEISFPPPYNPSNSSPLLDALSGADIFSGTPVFFDFPSHL